MEQQRERRRLFEHHEFQYVCFNLVGVQFNLYPSQYCTRFSALKVLSAYCVRRYLDEGKECTFYPRRYVKDRVDDPVTSEVVDSLAGLAEEQQKLKRLLLECQDQEKALEEHVAVKNLFVFCIVYIYVYVFLYSHPRVF